MHMKGGGVWKRVCVYRHALCERHRGRTRRRVALEVRALLSTRHAVAAVARQLAQPRTQLPFAPQRPPNGRVLRPGGEAREGAQTICEVPAKNISTNVNILNLHTDFDIIICNNPLE